MACQQTFPAVAQIDHVTSFIVVIYDQIISKNAKKCENFGLFLSGNDKFQGSTSLSGQKSVLFVESPWSPRKSEKVKNKKKLILKKLENKK